VARRLGTLLRGGAPPAAARAPLAGPPSPPAPSQNPGPLSPPTPLNPRDQGRIPLQDLVRFKERQWFVEELEVGRMLGGVGEGGSQGGSGASPGRPLLAAPPRAPAPPPPQARHAPGTPTSAPSQQENHLISQKPNPQNSRDGDANAMLRLAKMYLHGQGCARSAALAQDWLRKARALGAGAALEELYATDVRGGGFFLGGGGVGINKELGGREGWGGTPAHWVLGR
jgi:hypothetical protein